MSDRLIDLPPLLDVPALALAEPDLGARFEWLEADGEGGWAAGTAIGAATRRHHGLLIVDRPGRGRILLLARFEEVLLTADGERLDLGTNFYPGAVHPEGHRALAGFSLDPWPVWRYRLGVADLVRELFRSRRARALVLRYRWNGPPAALELRPLFAGRAVDSLTTANELVRRDAEASEGMVAFQPYDDVPPTVLTFVEGSWEPAPTWYYSTSYPRDGRTESRDDLFSPGVLRLPLRPGAPTTIACGLQAARVGRVDRRLNDELVRREAVARRGRRLAPDPDLSDLAARLALAADAFIARAATPPPVFPPGVEATRDLLIALPWLTLAAGGEEWALAMLRRIGGRADAGLLPVSLDAQSDVRAAADLPLWYVEAVASLAGRGLDTRPLVPVVTAILDTWLEGTRFAIRVGDDGLVTHGPGPRPMTWMDAMAYDQPVTPRWGRAVEINALWHNALLRGAELVGAGAERWIEAAARCREGFEAFWWQDAGYLVDVIDAAGHDERSLRPNQLLAVSLPRPVFVGARARRVAEAVERTLLLPTAVRTLAPGTEGYRRTDGGPQRGYAARHQGSAWTAWIGPFASAYLRAHDGDAPARRRVAAILSQCTVPLRDGLVGQPGERVAAEPPYTPEGAIATAWAVAGLIEALAALHAAAGRLPPGA